MKISILLPYKENFSPSYPGAVSLFVNDTTKLSNYNKNITIYGHTTYKKIFRLKYINIDLKKKLFRSQSKHYVNKFLELHDKNPSEIIEIHNRPNYVLPLTHLKSSIVLYFHNDPLSMIGSKNAKERIF